MTRAPPRCPRCRYNLTGLSEPRCPECGFALEDDWAARPPAPMPAWDRRGYVNVVYAFFATFLAFTFRPWRSLRGMRCGDGVLGAVAFYLLLIPWACVLTVGLCFVAAKVGPLFPGIENDGYWKLFLWSDKPRYRVGELISNGIRATAFMVAALLVWMPTLVALDLALWRDREAFRSLAKGLLYTAVWSCWAAAVAASVLGLFLDKLIGDLDLHTAAASTWFWGWRGAWPYGGWFPWVCWLVVVVGTAQALVLMVFVRAAWSPIDPRQRGRVRQLVLLGWLFVLYVLLLDRHIHLRFHLQFAPDELSFLYRWLQGP